MQHRLPLLTALLLSAPMPNNQTNNPSSSVQAGVVVVAAAVVSSVPLLRCFVWSFPPAMCARAWFKISSDIVFEVAWTSLNFDENCRDKQWFALLSSLLWLVRPSRGGRIEEGSENATLWNMYPSATPEKHIIIDSPHLFPFMTVLTGNLECHATSHPITERTCARRTPQQSRTPPPSLPPSLHPSPLPPSPTSRRTREARRTDVDGDDDGGEGRQARSLRPSEEGRRRRRLVGWFVGGEGGFLPPGS